MRFLEYERWLEERVANASFEDGCVHIGPWATPTVTPNKPPWDLEWVILFKGDYYLRLVEHWYRRGSHLGGGGYRKTFSFHYGPTNPNRNAEGVPLPSDLYPAVLRIDDDDDWRGAHLHFDGENHIIQARVKNLRISDVDLFDFIEAVLEHRRTGKRFDEIMDFEVTK
jgi:hypothetical protein